MRQFLKFELGPESRLVELERVVEVLPVCALQDLEDQAEGGCCGLLEFRGRVVPVFDPAEEGVQGRTDLFLLVLRAEAREVAVVARDIDGVVEVDEEACCEFPGRLRPVQVAQVADRLLKILTPAGLV